MTRHHQHAGVDETGATGTGFVGTASRFTT